MKRLLAFVVMISILAPFPSAKADPSPGIQFLMNEPVSMLDWGFFHWRNEIDEKLRYMESYLEDPPSFHVEPIYYNFDLNKIWIDINVYSNEIGLPKAKALCKKVVERLQADALFIDHLFSHSGWSKSSRPWTKQELSSFVKEITEIRLHARYREKNETLEFHILRDENGNVLEKLPKGPIYLINKIQCVSPISGDVDEIEFSGPYNTDGEPLNQSTNQTTVPE